MLTVDSPKEIFLRILRGEEISSSSLNDNQIQDLIDFSLKNNIALYVLDHLRTSNDKREGVLESYNKINKLYTLRYLSQKRTIYDISEIFNLHNIKYSFLKGVPLSLCAYKVPKLRFMRDLDILVRNQDLIKVVNIFLDRGYKSSINKNYNKMTYFNFDYSHQAPGLVSPDNIQIDIHHRVTTDLNTECKLSSDILENSIDQYMDERAIKVPKQKHLYLHLCSHGLSNFSGGAIFFLDLFELLKISEKNAFSFEIEELNKYGMIKEVEVAKGIVEKNLFTKEGIRNEDLGLFSLIIDSYELSSRSTERLKKVNYFFLESLKFFLGHRPTLLDLKNILIFIGLKSKDYLKFLFKYTLNLRFNIQRLALIRDTTRK
mgnify:FL=1